MCLHQLRRFLLYPASLLCATALWLLVAACSPQEQGGSDDAAPAASEPSSAGVEPAAATTEVICSSPVRPSGVMAISSRFGLWNLGTSSVPAGTDPSSAFDPVVPNQFAGLRGKRVYVLTHGWAPGWNQTVIDNGNKILWWSKEAGIQCSGNSCMWPSDFAWASSTVSYEGKPFQVSESGLLAAIKTVDPDAIVMAYSWLDDSATEGSLLAELNCAYHSEGYTNLNGLRLAAGLISILREEFWEPNRGNALHLIGHSHGTKVVTTATKALQGAGLQVEHLTILDSPENLETRTIEAANFNWLYLAGMDISNAPSKGVPGSIFVDNYVSEFGIDYNDFDELSGIVDVNLDPQQLFGDAGASDDHTYAATWYAGAANGGKQLQPPQLLGLEWSPLLQPLHTASLKPAYNQTWPKVNPVQQFELATSSPDPSMSFDLVQLELTDVSASGGAVWNEITRTLSFPGSGQSSISGDFSCGGSFLDFEGVAFEISYDLGANDSQLVVKQGDDRYMVIDGDPGLTGQHLVSFNGSESSSLSFHSQGTSTSAGDWLTIRKLRYIELEG